LNPVIFIRTLNGPSSIFRQEQNAANEKLNGCVDGKFRNEVLVGIRISFEEEIGKRLENVPVGTRI
jgi:hypothetical protein